MTIPPEPAARGEFVPDIAGTVGLSQSRIVARRFLAHRGAVISVGVLVVITVLAFSSVGFGPFHGWWKYGYEDVPPVENKGRPTLGLFPPTWGDHPFGQNDIGRDYFAMVMRGTQISLHIMVIVGLVAGLLGVVIGGVAGYFRGWLDAALMRLTDMVIVIPSLVAAAVIAHVAQQLGGDPRGDVAELRRPRCAGTAGLAGPADLPEPERDEHPPLAVLVSRHADHHHQPRGRRGHAERRRRRPVPA